MYQDAKGKTGEGKERDKEEEGGVERFLPENNTTSKHDVIRDVIVMDDRA